MTDHTGTMILVVDDDADMRDMMTMWLRVEGYDVRVASNGREALEALQRERPCAMVVDLHMPIMDGAELRHQQQQQRADIAHGPFILVSAGHDTERVGRALGVDEVIPKPFDATRLLDALATHC